MPALKDFKAKIARRRAVVGVVGLGYVGLPLAMAFVKAGFKVTGFDVDKGKVATLKNSRSHVMDVPAAVVASAVKKGAFRATADFSALSSVDAVIICVPTPLNGKKEPDLSYIESAGREIARHLKRGQLVVLESTTYPGTTEEILLPILEKKGLVADRDFFLAFSPERVDPGNKRFDTASIPKVIGGYGSRSLEAATLLYGTAVHTVVSVSSPRTAEMAKLLENTFRAVNIALVNEMANVCHKVGVDVWEVIEAAKTKPFGFMPFYPGPGIGGHCLPIDPLYLSWKSRRLGHEARLIEIAATVNREMPAMVVERVRGLLNARKKALRNTAIAVLGVSYKKDVDDVRESPALEVLELLDAEGARATYSDPHAPSVRVGKKTFKSQKLTAAFLKKQACVILLTDHSKFDSKLIASASALILDTRNALRKHQSSAQGRLYFI